MPKRKTKRKTSSARTRRKARLSTLKAYHIPLVVSAAIVTTLIVVLTGGGTGQFVGDLSNAPDAFMEVTGPATTAVNQQDEYTFKIGNKGNRGMTKITVEVSPLYYTFVSSPETACREEDRIVKCNFRTRGSLEPGNTISFTAIFRTTSSCLEDEEKKAYIAATVFIAERQNDKKNDTDVHPASCA